jgi:hypothetical protein
MINAAKVVDIDTERLIDVFRATYCAGRPVCREIQSRRGWRRL